MEAFKVPPQLSQLVANYPSAKEIRDATSNSGEQTKIFIARLWLSEGIPFAFRGQPALYESVRSWLAAKLDVNPKEVNLTGSARIGQALNPSKHGTPFGEHSDLDIFVVSESLFGKIASDFNKWSFDFECGKELPSNEREREFWRANNERGPNLIRRGFLDSYIVPNRHNYLATKNIAQTMFLLKGKLDITAGAPRVKSASIRCYKDWASFINQMIISL